MVVTFSFMTEDGIRELQQRQRWNANNDTKADVVVIEKRELFGAQWFPKS